MVSAVEEALAAHKTMNEARRDDYEVRQADFDANMPEEVLLDDWAHFERNPKDGYQIRYWQEGCEPWLGRGELDPDLKEHRVIIALHTDAEGKRWLLYIWYQTDTRSSYTKDSAVLFARRRFWEGFKVVQPLRWQVPEGLYR